MKTSILLLSLAIPLASANAGQEGHGGEAYVCRDLKTARLDPHTGIPDPKTGNINSVELWDYFYGEETRSSDLKIDTGNPNAPYLEQAQYIINRIAKVDSVTASRFNRYLKDFPNETNWLERSAIKEMSDYTTLIDSKKNCYRMQFAVRRKSNEMKPYDKRFLIDKEIWTAANDQQRAGLILHEFIYRDANEDYGQELSDNSMYYNQIMSSNVANNMTAKEYWNLLGTSEFSHYSNHGWETTQHTLNGFSVTTAQGVFAPWENDREGMWEPGVKFYDDGSVEWGHPIGNYSITVAKKPITLYGLFLPYIYFRQNGTIQYFSMSMIGFDQSQLEIKIEGKPIFPNLPGFYGKYNIGCIEDTDPKSTQCDPEALNIKSDGSFNFSFHFNKGFFPNEVVMLADENGNKTIELESRYAYDVQFAVSDLNQDPRVVSIVRTKH